MVYPFLSLIWFVSLLYVSRMQDISWACTMHISSHYVVCLFFLMVSFWWGRCFMSFLLCMPFSVCILKKDLGEWCFLFWLSCVYSSPWCCSPFIQHISSWEIPDLSSWMALFKKKLWSKNPLLPLPLTYISGFTSFYSFKRPSMILWTCFQTVFQREPTNHSTIHTEFSRKYHWHGQAMKIWEVKGKSAPKEESHINSNPTWNGFALWGCSNICTKPGLLHLDLTDSVKWVLLSRLEQWSTGLFQGDTVRESSSQDSTWPLRDFRTWGSAFCPLVAAQLSSMPFCGGGDLRERQT